MGLRDRRMRAFDDEIGAAALDLVERGKAKLPWDLGEPFGRAVPCEGDLEPRMRLCGDGAIERPADEAEADEADAFHAVSLAAARTRRKREPSVRERHLVIPGRARHRSARGRESTLFFPEFRIPFP